MGLVTVTAGAWERAELQRNHRLGENASANNPGAVALLPGYEFHGDPTAPALPRPEELPHSAANLGGGCPEDVELPKQFRQFCREPVATEDPARTVVVIGILAILGGIGAQGQNVAFLVALAFAVAASANLPTILYSLFWRGFTTQGALWSMYGGLASALILIVFSPVMSGTETSMIPGADFALFPLKNPGLISIPLAFFLGWLGSVLDRRREDPVKQAEMEVRSLTGVGAEKAVEH